MSGKRQRYYLTLSHTLPEEARDVRRKLRHADTWRDGKKAHPDSGDWATGSVDLTPTEVPKVEAASNVLRVEEVPPAPKPAVDAIIPAEADLQSHKMDMLDEWGFTGQGIDVGVIDTGLGSGVASKFNIKAIRSEIEEVSPYGSDHGSKSASLAVPRQSRLVFSRAQNESYEDYGFDGSSWMNALYWMVDEVGVHLVNMSISTYSFSQGGADVVAHALGAGVQLFASAGNGNRDARGHYPSDYSGVVSVGALDRTAGWKKASFSNYGPAVDLWMNGVDVAAYGPDGSIVDYGGTSAASPLATYVHASLLTKGLTSIGQIQVRAAIKRGGDRVPTGIGGDPSGPYDPRTGAGGGMSSRPGGRRVNGENAAWAMREFCT